MGKVCGKNMSRAYEECKSAIESLIRKENTLKFQLREIEKVKEECIKILIKSLVEDRVNENRKRDIGI